MSSKIIEIFNDIGNTYMRNINTLIMYAKLIMFLYSDIGDRCTTPNGEVATCKPVIQCEPIATALKNHTKGAVEFARKSHCGGVGVRTLVCCGSVGVETRFGKDY